MNLIAHAWQPGMDLPDAFLELPAQIYRNDAFWLGENPDSLRQQFSAANPWFQQGQAWLGVVPHQARLAAFVLPGQYIDGEQAAFFGFWESVEDLAVNRELFAVMHDWARSHGARRVYGPINFTTFAANRIRLDGFADGAFRGEPWNPPYYSQLLAALGYAIRYRYVSTFAQLADIVPAVQRDYARYQSQLAAHFRFATLTSDFWLSHLDELYGFVDSVFAANFAYTPISRDSFAQLCGAAYAARFCPHSSVMAQTLDGKLAGFFIASPDDSRTGAQKRRVLAKTGGVLPEFRASGLFTAMSCELTLRAAPYYDEVVGALVREDNASLQFAARHGQSRQHHYALYTQALQGAQP